METTSGQSITTTTPTSTTVTLVEPPSPSSSSSSSLSPPSPQPQSQSAESTTTTTTTVTLVEPKSPSPQPPTTPTTSITVTLVEPPPSPSSPPRSQQQSTKSKSIASPKMNSPLSSPPQSPSPSSPSQSSRSQSPSPSPSPSQSSNSSPSNPLPLTVKSPSTDSTILAQKEHEISKLVEEIQRLKKKIKTMQHDKPSDGRAGGGDIPDEDLEETEAPVALSSYNNNLSPLQLNTKSLPSGTSSNTTTTLTSANLISGHHHHHPSSLHHHSHSQHSHHSDLMSTTTPTTGPLNFHHHRPLDRAILSSGDRSTSVGNPLSSLSTNSIIGTNVIPLESHNPAVLQRLQEALRQNVDKFMNESLNTGNISRCVRDLLQMHNIGQRLFARYVLGLSQGTVSELLSKPKPWDKLTEKGRDSYRKMHAWAADENCINLLKSLVVRKGKEQASFKQDDPVAEEKIRQILIEAQGAMITPTANRTSSTTSGLLRNQIGSGLSNGEIIGRLGLSKGDKMTTSIIGIGGGGNSIGVGMGSGGRDDDDSDSDSERSTPGDGGRSPPLITSSSSLAHLHSSSNNNGLDQASGLSAASNHHYHHLSQLHHKQNNSSSLVNSNSPAGILSSLRSSSSVSGNNGNYVSNSKVTSETDKQLSHDMVARIYQEEFAKLIGQQVEEGFRHPHGMPFDRNPDQIRQAFTIYHQELSRLHQLVSSGAVAAAATDPEIFARLAAASLVNGAGYLGLPHLLPGLNLPSSRSPSRGADGKGTPEPGREAISPQDLHHHHNQRLSSSPSSSSPPPSSHLANSLLLTSNGGNGTNLSSANNHDRSTPNSPDIDSDSQRRSSSSQQTSAFSLVRPPHELGSKQQSGSPALAAAVAAAAVAVLPVGLDLGSNGYSSSSSTTPTNMSKNSVSNNNNNGPSSAGAEDLSASASPLQRIQSITNSLLSQSSVPPISPTPSRPSKAVLPPITQNQFDHYNNLNTEDIVKKVKEQLSQYSISQRLFGESVLGLSQGSVSDLLARPKPWHMLTQKGREPFIRMKMFLEDDNAVHKLVASQYKIAPEKLMRTGGYAGTPIITTPTGSQVASLIMGANSGSINMSSVTGVTTPTTPSINHHHHTATTLSPNHGNTCSMITTGSVKGSPASASSASTPEHTPNATLISNHSPPLVSGSSSYLKRRYDGSTPLSVSGIGGNSNGSNSNNNGGNNNSSNDRSTVATIAAAAAAAGVSYMQPSVYEMAAITQDFDTTAITTKIKETLMAHNIGQKIFGEIVLGLSQGSVSELLSKPKPWSMLSIKGREPFIRMKMWLTDSGNIERLQAIKNERREMNKKRRINGDEVSSISSTKSTSSSNPGIQHHHLNINNTSSSYQQDEIGTLDLSMPSKSHHQHQARSPSPPSKISNNNNNHHYSMSGKMTEDSDDSETGSLEDSSSSRRRHLISRHHHGKNTTTTITMNPISSSTSSSSRRKPAIPQWVAPDIDCFGDDEEDDVDSDHLLVLSS